MRRALPALGVVALLTLLVVGVLYVRRATMSTNTDPVSGTRTEVVVEAAKRREPAYTLEELTTALVTSCRIYVDSQVVEPVTPVGTARYRVVFYPALNDSDQRELHGCLEDARLDHVLLDVVSMELTAPQPGADGTGAGASRG